MVSGRGVFAASRNGGLGQLAQTAIFLASHVVVGSKPETDKLREDVLAIHLEAVRQLVTIKAELMVRQLVTINAELMGTTGEEDG
jgi:hypothetical protein